MSHAITITALLLAFALAASPVACTMHRQQLVADAIAAGIDPIAARCGIEGPMHDTKADATCIVKAMTRSTP